MTKFRRLHALTGGERERERERERGLKKLKIQANTTR